MRAEMAVNTGKELSGPLCQSCHFVPNNPPREYYAVV